MAPKPEVVRDLDHLRRLVVIEGWREFAIVLAGGAAYSRKTITKTSARVGAWSVKNHIDGTRQRLTDEGLWTESNIGEAIDKGALIRL